MDATMPPIRTTLCQAVIAAARQDARVVGVLDYGSSSEGRSDAWSDIDLALFIRDADLPAFLAQWTDWAAQFGPLLLAYVGGIGHPWTVYDTQPLPLRVDYALHPASTLTRILEWPNSPSSAAAMVLYDATGGELTRLAGQLVGRALDPTDLEVAFTQVCGDLWYYTLRTWSILQRGHEWAAFSDLHFILFGNLLALLRLEANATARWRSSSAAVGIETDIAPERLAALNRCRQASQGGVATGLLVTAQLIYEVSAEIAERQGWEWPRRLAERLLELLGAPTP
jgi:hypothetical protein